VLKPFYNEPAYISSLSARIKSYLDKNEFDAYIFSYHGLPARHIKKTDPTKNHCLVNDNCCEVKSIAWDFCYRHQVKETTKLVAQKLKLEPSKVLLSFQSRLGSGWLEPFTDMMFTELPQKGVKKLLVITPSFVTDCLETLEEINIRGKKSFLESGGEEFVSVPCLNSMPQWVDAFAAYCNKFDGEYKLLWN
jgi:protoporphyrin/coproporphyrin ferrochelatase